MSKPSFIQTIKSILAAFIGVQSEQNRKIDFEQGSMASYIVAGLIFTVLFISVIIFVVSKVLNN
ncbi:MAG: DUF2970 domain-containing protein [Methylococcaceae bacterium]|nr:DUF2970 domain-containing protein [Methylococcaceae bacterium]